MNTTAGSARLVSALAVTAMCVVAVGAAAAGWMARSTGGAAPTERAAVEAARPPADEPVRVVKAPAEADAMRRPVHCPQCDDARLPENQL